MEFLVVILRDRQFFKSKTFTMQDIYDGEARAWFDFNTKVVGYFYSMEIKPCKDILSGENLV